MTSVQFTVGKLDAGMVSYFHYNIQVRGILIQIFFKIKAILLTEDHHLIEFPSLLLPKGVTSGSIVNIAVSRNLPEEKKKMNEFLELQETILAKFGNEEPEVPVVRVKDITQTSLILEWNPLLLHTAKLRSLDIYKNGTKLAQVKQ